MKILIYLYYFIFPFISVWLIMFYLRFLVYLNQYRHFNDWVLVLMFVPAVFLEVIFSKLFLKGKSAGPRHTSGGKVFLSIRLIFWSLLFLVWVIIMPSDYKISQWLDFFHFSLIPMFAMVYIAEYYLSFIMLGLWMYIYIIFTVRKRKIRHFTCLWLPAIFSYMLFYHYYFLGGIGDVSLSKISSQEGVEVYYTRDDFPKDNYSHFIDWKTIDRFPRDIFIDEKENALYVNYANTYAGGAQYRRKLPYLLRIDIPTKETRYIYTKFVRTMNVGPAGILVSPMFDYEINELDKKDLTVKRIFEAPLDIERWETISIHHDIRRKAVFLTNDMRAILFKYDYESGKLVNAREFFNIRYGGTLWNIQVSDKTGKLYVSAFGGKNDIYEIDTESLRVLRTKDLVSYGVSSLKLDDSAGILYAQDGGTDRLFEIDIDSFRVRRILRGEVHSRRMFIDRKRNAIYVLSYFYGRLTGVDLRTGRHIWSIKTGGKSYGLDISGDTAFINSRRGIIKIDLNRVWQHYHEMNRKK
ncbi:YncE family protein [Elusimicrobiota bacterium]